jgi:biopolymer transport protein ExbD
MGAKLQGADDDAISDINVTPFVDVVLVLLIVLMIAAVNVAHSAITVDLPTAAAEGESVASTLNIIIEADGQMLLDGERADEEAIAARVRAEKEGDAKVQAVIAADRTVPYERVMHAIDLVKQNGVTSFALSIERKAE